MPKNIVILSDGTGQEGGKGNNTNVYKLFNAIEDRSPGQISFYDEGLGTGFRKFTGRAFGMGITHNILECYKFLMCNYESHDNIYLFGFSRGAATVRSLSSFINLFGILPSSRTKLVKEAWRIYKIPDKDRRNRRAANLIADHHTMWVNIKFLGVWDTVAALGVPYTKLDKWVDKIFRHKFQDITLSHSVDAAYHALAIDDERKTFHPTLWNGTVRKGQTLKQVWFCGMHTDVGGGYAQEGLSDIALEWMIDSADQHGLLLYKKNTLATSPNEKGKMHDSREGAARAFRKKQRTWDPKHGKPCIHESVLQRKNQSNGNYNPWIAKINHDVEPWRKLKKNPHGGLVP